MFSIRGAGQLSDLPEGSNLIVDSQGDAIDLDALEKAAYGAVLSGLIGDEQHERDLPDVRVVESFVLTPDKAAAMGIPA